MNSQVPGRKIPRWLEDFVHTIGNKKEVVAKTEVVAEIKFEDLPKVVWNDETFGVEFDSEKGEAKIINHFLNEVTTLKNVNSIEDVDKVLNSKQIVKSEFDIELQKVIEADNVISDPNNPGQEQPIQDPNQPQVPENDPLNSDPNQNLDPNQQVVAVNANADVEEENDGDLIEDIEKVGNTLDYIQRIAALEEQVNNLTNVVEELKGQLYAHQDPGAIYDNGAAAEEQKHFEETSKATEEQIMQDNAVDITTMNGRVSLVDRLRQELKPILDEQPKVKETDVMVNETNPVEVNNEEIIPETDIEDEKPLETDVELEDDVKPTDIQLDTSDDIDEDNKEDDKENDDGNSKKPGIVGLGSKDSKIFRKAICPECGEEGLTKAANVESFVGVYCKHCSAEYAVNIDTEEIFKKN